MHRSGTEQTAVDLDVQTIATIGATALPECVCASQDTAVMLARLCAQICVLAMAFVWAEPASATLASPVPIATQLVCALDLVLQLVNAAVKASVSDQISSASVSLDLLGQIALSKTNAVSVDAVFMVVVPTVVVIVTLGLKEQTAKKNLHVLVIAAVMVSAIMPSAFAILDSVALLVKPWCQIRHAPIIATEWACAATVFASVPTVRRAWIARNL